MGRVAMIYLESPANPTNALVDVEAVRDARDAGRPLDEYMAMEARRFYGATGLRVASHAPEAFLRGGADAGMLRIVR